MKKLTVTLLITTACIFGHAQSTDKNANIRKLLEVTGTGKMAKMVADNMLNSYMFSASLKDSTFFLEFKKEINVEGFIELIIPVYDKYYTDQDITDLLAFYNSPVGKKVIVTLPALTQESMTVGQQWGKSIGEKILSKMQEKGISSNHK